MNRRTPRLLVAGLCTILPGTSPFAAAGNLASDPIVAAVRHRDCPRAVRELNAAVGMKDSQTALFVGGRMLDEGICVKRDPEAATEYFARSAALGDQNAALDYAAKVGMGQGVPQDYLRAGNLCHSAGADPEGRLTPYALGYACTVRGVAGRMLRESLPKGAFLTPTAPAMVEFSPGSSQMHILSVPKVERAEAKTGSFIGAPLVNARQVIENAWRDAVAAVPRPVTADLGSEVVQVPLDLDTTLEVGRSAPSGALDISQILPGEYHSLGANGQH
jgi:hypothetical protein